MRTSLESTMSAASERSAWAVVTTYNGARWIRACLDSLTGQRLAGIVVVDNNSADETVGVIRSTYPQVEVVELAENLGFGLATNHGIQRALERGAQYVVLINQDVIVETGALRRLVDLMECQPGLAALSPMQLNYEGDAVDATFRQFFPADFWDDLVLRESKPVYEVPFAPAGAMMLRRSALLQVGGFDPLFFMYGEDNDLCWRLLAAGWTLGLTPQARVRHWHGIRNEPRSLRRQANMQYSSALLHLKQSPRRLPLAFASLVHYWKRPGMAQRATAKIIALARCLLRYRRIDEHRSVVPYTFTASPSMAVNPATQAHGEVRTAKVD